MTCSRTLGTTTPRRSSQASSARSRRNTPTSSPRSSRTSSETGLLSLRWKTVRPVRGLVADVENSPGTYGGGDYTHPHLTTIACQFTDDDVGFAWVLDRRKPQQMRKMAKDFAGLWEQADFIVGHNFRRHDI